MTMFQTKPSELILKNLWLEKQSQKNGLSTQSLSWTQVEGSSLVDLREMLVWPEEKLSLTLMVDGEDMEEEPSQERTHQK